MKDHVVVSFAETPLLGQAGLDLQQFFSPHACLELYKAYIDESAAFFAAHNYDFWLTCSDTHQEMLLLQNFPHVHGVKLIGGNMNEKMQGLTHYFLSYQNYKTITFLFKPFTFILPELQKEIALAFRRTSCSAVLITDEASGQLVAMSVSFPFSELFTDITWEKEQLASQIKTHCKNSEIPCRVVSSENILIINQGKLHTEVDAQVEKYYHQLFKQLYK